MTHVEGCKKKAEFNKRSRYEMKSIGGTTKLVKRGTDLVVLSTDEMFDHIHTTHIQLGKVLPFLLLLFQIGVLEWRLWGSHNV